MNDRINRVSIRFAREKVVVTTQRRSARGSISNIRTIEKSPAHRTQSALKLATAEAITELFEKTSTPG